MNAGQNNNKMNLRILVLVHLCFGYLPAMADMRSEDLVAALQKNGWVHQKKIFPEKLNQMVFQAKLDDKIILWTLYFYKRSGNESELKLNPDEFEKKHIKNIVYNENYKSIIINRRVFDELITTQSVEIESYSRIGEIDFVLSSRSADLNKVSNETLNKTIEIALFSIISYLKK